MSSATFRLRTSLDFEEIRTRLRSEYGSAIQSSEISGSLADVDKDIQDCDAEIRRLQARVVFIQNQRLRLEDYRSCLKYLRAPIRHLPNETLLRIFDFACDINIITSKTLKMIPSLGIASTCSRWRNLAKSCPSLWSHLRLEMWKEPRLLADLPILELFLHHSQQSLLDLEIEGRGHDEELMTDELSLCDRLSSRSSRWRRLAVSDSWRLFTEYLHRAQDLPALEHLYGWDVSIAIPGFMDLLQSVKLKSWSLSDIDLEEPYEHKYPWHTLRKLDIAQCNEEMRAVFQKSVNLKKLCFHQFGDDAIKRCSPPLAVPFVEKLHLLVYNFNRPDVEQLANAIFSSITCPSLTSLSVEAEAGHYDNVWPKAELEHFISRSACRLTALSLKYFPLSDSDLLSLLRYLPALLHLTIDDSRIPSSAPTPITDNFIENLHSCRGSSSTIPSAIVKRLRTLSLTFSGLNFQDKTFVDMVSSRWCPTSYARKDGTLGSSLSDLGELGTACLRSVVMRFPNRLVNKEIYRPLDYLEEEGLRVVIIAETL